MRRQRTAAALVGLLAAAGSVLAAGAAGVVPPSPPLGFPPVPVPEANPLTAAKVALGERLFFDPALSSDKTISCASCHRPERAFADAVPVSPGVGGEQAVRNSPSVLNTAYFPVIFWDGRSPDLEDQVRYPVVHPKEMNMQRDEVVDLLVADPSYVAGFEAAFGDPEVTFDRVSAAIASFERTLVAGDSPFDRFFFSGDERAISDSARRGWELFRGRLGCIECHRFDAEQPFFTDLGFHNTGAGFDALSPDLGRYRVTGERSDKGKFRTPSLRNVALTAPYMHDGSFATLDKVLDFYQQGGFPNRYQDERIRPLELSAEERADLIQFLHSLNGELAYSPPGPEGG